MNTSLSRKPAPEVTAELLPGTVTLVGGGPGDPALITVAGLRAVQQADVILYDRLAPLECLEEAREGAELVNVGKIPRGDFTPQEQINALLVEKAQAGLKVVRLKGGDSFVFGRGGEEWQACAEASVPVRVIPGVTSAIAAPELAGIPVTHRGLTQGFTVVSGHVPPGDSRSTVNWAALAQANTTIVILMGIKYLPQIVAELVAAGLSNTTPAAVVMNAGHDNMRALHVDLANLVAVVQENVIEPPAVTIIGQVAGLNLDLGDSESAQ